VFKEPFESKLKELKIKTKFIKNLKARAKEIGVHAESKINTLDYRDFCNFISSAFVWSYTPEGFYYWRNISETK
jgi:hypothetical protein